MYARGRPQIWHRLRCRTENFCGLFQRSIADFLANLLQHLFHLRKGIPSWVSRLRPSSSVLAVVTTVTSRPRSLSILS